MTDDNRTVLSMARLLLSNDLSKGASSVPVERISEVVRLAALHLKITITDIEPLIATLEASFQTVIGAERTLSDQDGWSPWLYKKKADISWGFWNRYSDYLEQEKAWPPVTISSMDRITDQVLDLLTDPVQGGAWDRRGMVVGHVQSGKTSNYIGLITKAADAGYKIIVVLAGFHKSLRSQTQIRLEEGFLGYDMTASPGGPTGPRMPTGVGRVDRYGVGPKADSITTRADDGDFKRTVARSFAINPGGNPLLFVIKKNGSVLRNLLNWVRGVAEEKDDSGRAYIRNVPLLVIDDEADQGSIDTRKGAFDEHGEPDPDHDPTRLNSLIRQLLHMFDQSAYVGYTATPFANILIHEEQRTAEEGDDLFPRSFILSLPVDSNYVGPSKVFGSGRDEEETQPLPIIREVKDHADSLEVNERYGWVPPKHDKSLRPRFEGIDGVPPSLGEAIRAFVLVCAARTARGDSRAHNTMLVHVTRFTAVQGRIEEQVSQELADIKLRLRHGDGASSFQLLRELQSLWNDDFVPTTRELHDAGEAIDCTSIEWQDVRPHIARAAESIKIRTINGLAGEVLDYMTHSDNGLNVVAIGGDKLSRGLTLEGLSISYFLRASRMYDTLMQMGRWFGYRPRFLDLCRLYTTPEMIEWFGHITDASNELREDFNLMAASGGTPRDFGHRVKSHPVMLVTSGVKMRTGTKIDVTFQGDISETINFRRTKAAVQRNWTAGIKLIDRIEAGGATAELAVRLARTAGNDGVGPWIWRHVSTDAILGFLADYEEHPVFSIRVKTKLLSDYIEMERQLGRLTSWSVFLASGDSGVLRTLGSVRTTLVERAWAAPPGIDRDQLIRTDHYRIKRLVSPTDERADLSEAELEEALARTKRDYDQDPNRAGKVPKAPSGTRVRAVRKPQKGLLLLYPLDPGDPMEMRVEDEARETPVLGFAISFPRVDLERATRVQYIVNNIYWKQEVNAPAEVQDEEH